MRIIIECISIVGGIILIGVGASTGVIPLVIAGCGMVAIPILGRLASRRRMQKPNYDFFSDDILHHVSYALQYERMNGRG